ncbi:MAG: tRNA guanosine(34) transglycosylase Tgt [archaeon]|jgi:queuine tRNA-ribosyltransferase
MPCFEIVSESENSSTRAGILSTVHGKVETPFLMPVATKGAVKFISHPDLKKFEIDCIISNAFINYLKPGLETISKAGGLHKFISWDKSMFTDSGGFQLLSENFVHNVNDKGVYFRNPFDKSIELISPEKAIQIENTLGSDVAMCLDHLAPFGASRQEHIRALIRTIEWAQRCHSAHKNKNQLLFGITQGGTFLDLRKKAALAFDQMDFDGMAFGGLCIGEPASEMHKITSYSKKFVSKEKPIYLMGVGSPLEILELVSLGVDVFDSAYPTRMARHGKIFTHAGVLQIDRGACKHSFVPLDKNCECFVCKNHSRAYLHHLFKTHEQNGQMLLSYHNTFFMANLLKEIRLALKENRFEKYKLGFEKNYSRNSTKKLE